MDLAMRVLERRTGVDAQATATLREDETFRPAQSFPKPLTLAVLVLSGMALGLAATDEAVTRRIDVGATRLGAWTTWPGAGTVKIDPYARAIFATDGEVPLAAGQGLLYSASRDDKGRPLSRNCAYRITGLPPPARHWTLTATTPEGFFIANPADRQGFADNEVLRHMDGSFTIEVAPRARPGNWLPVRGEGPLVMVLRLYDTALATESGPPARVVLPAVQRQDCGPP